MAGAANAVSAAKWRRAAPAKTPRTACPPRSADGLAQTALLQRETRRDVRRDRAGRRRGHGRHRRHHQPRRGRCDGRGDRGALRPARPRLPAKRRPRSNFRRGKAATWSRPRACESTIAPCQSRPRAEAAGIGGPAHWARTVREVQMIRCRLGREIPEIAGDVPIELRLAVEPAYLPSGAVLKDVGVLAYGVSTSFFAGIDADEAVCARCDRAPDCRRAIRR